MSIPTSVLPSRLLALLGLLALLVAGSTGLLHADDDDASPEAVQAEVEDLVAQLAAPDFEARERATERLLAIGEPARAALERAMRESENMEARWRAEQILKRLDRRGESVVEPREGEAPAPARPGVRPEGLPRGRPLPLDDMETLRERLQQELERWGFGLAGERHVLEAPGLRLAIEGFGPLVRLRLAVLDETTGAEGPVHRGRSLEEIRRRNPDLVQLPGWSQLEGEYEAFRQAHPSLFAFEDLTRELGAGRAGITLGGTMPGRSVSVTHTPDGVRVEITRRGEDGQEEVDVYEGEDLDTLKAEHPELAEALGGFQIELRIGPTQLFRHRFGQPLPVPPSPEVITPSEPDPGPRLGVVVEPLDAALAFQLGLPAGRAALVTQVLPDSQADRLGLERYDVIVTIDGRAVEDVADAVDRLRKAAADETAPLRIEVLRRKERVELSR